MSLQSANTFLYKYSKAYKCYVYMFVDMYVQACFYKICLKFVCGQWQDFLCNIGIFGTYMHTYM